MFYRYETDAGVFLLRRQAFTEHAWELLFDGRFVDCWPCPFQAALDLARNAAAIGITAGLLLPPPTLRGWEVHWAEGNPGEAPELWLHQMHLQGRRPGLPREDRAAV